MQIYAELLEDFLRAKREFREASAKKNLLPDDEWDILMDSCWDELDVAWGAIQDEFDSPEDYGINLDNLEQEYSLNLARIS